MLILVIIQTSKRLDRRLGGEGAESGVCTGEVFAVSRRPDETRTS